MRYSYIYIFMFHWPSLSHMVYFLHEAWKQSPAKSLLSCPKRDSVVLLLKGRGRMCHGGQLAILFINHLFI